MLSTHVVEREANGQRVRIEASMSMSVKPAGYESVYLHSDDAPRLLVPGVDGMPPLDLREHGGELWLAEVTTGKLVSVKDPLLTKLGIWGVRVRGDDHYDATLQIGDVELVREPDNPFDANAVAIFQHGERIGYFNKQKARRLAKVLDAGLVLEAFAISVKPPKVIAASPEIMAHLRA